MNKRLSSIAMAMLTVVGALCAAVPARAQLARGARLAQAWRLTKEALTA